MLKDEVKITNPYKNEHACRLKEPTGYDEFRRKNGEITIGDKKADAIYGIKNSEGRAELQSVRFPANVFSVEEAKSWCGNNGGIKFEAAVSQSSEDEDEGPEDEVNRELFCPHCGVELPDPFVEACPYCGEWFKEALKSVKYNFIKHWVAGDLTYKNESNSKHYDLIIDDKQFVFKLCPMENDGAECSLREPYSKNFIDKNDGVRVLLKKREPGHIGDGAPCWMRSLESGELSLLKDTDEMCVLYNADKSEIWSLVLADVDKNVWIFTKEQRAIAGKQELKCTLKSAPIRIEKLSKNELGNYEVSGNILTNGTWNQIYYTVEAVKGIPEEWIKNLRVDVGIDHDDKIVDAGTVAEYKWNEMDNGWWIRAVISDGDAIKLIDEMENVGFSVEVMVLVDRLKGMGEKITQLDCVVVVENPACKVCYLE